jgi:hypothetical protein
VRGPLPSRTERAAAGWDLQDRAARIPGVVLLIVAAIVLLALPAPASAERHERPRLGLSVEVPAGWRVVRRPLSPCIDPAQRVALRGHGALVQIVERLDADPDDYPQRPRRFTLPGKPQFLACCPPAEGKGWFLTFRDAGRGFHAYVYVGRPETRAQALRILDSFRVRPLLAST